MVSRRLVSEICLVSCKRVIERMKEEGCDAVILGCTEVLLIMSDSNSPLPTLDSTRLLARAALRRAVENESLKECSQ